MSNSVTFLAVTFGVTFYGKFYENSGKFKEFNKNREFFAQILKNFLNFSLMVEYLYLLMQQIAKLKCAQIN